MAKRKKRVFSPEFKAKAVALFRAGDRTVSQVAVDLSLGDSVLRNWIRQADATSNSQPAEALDSAEKAELARLRKDNKQLRLERDILKSAAIFFAKENE